MKKLICLLLAVAMLFTLAAACGSSSSEQQSSTPASSTPASSDAGNDEPLTVNKYGWEVPAETITLTYFAADHTGAQEEEDARLQPLADWFLNEFNLKINKVCYKQEDDGTERLNLMLAGNDYPECITAMPDAVAENFISQGRALELSAVLEANAPDLLSAYGGYINLLKNDEGELYKLANSYGNTTDQWGRAFSIRYDWWKETGEEMFSSLEGYYENMKAILEIHPTTDLGEPIYAFTAFTAKGEEFYQAPLAFMGFKGTSTGYYRENSDGSITHWVDTEEGLEVAKYINRFWREGMIDPDFQTKDYDQSCAFMSTDRVAGNIGTWWHMHVGGRNIWSEDPEWDPERRFINVNFTIGDATPALVSDNFIRTTRTILTDKCSEEQAANFAKYWNWESTPIGQVTGALGIPEGENDLWHLDENGEIVVGDGYFYEKTTIGTWDECEETGGSFGYIMQAPGYMVQNRDSKAGYPADSSVMAVNLWDFILDPATAQYDRLSEAMALQYQLEAEYTPEPYLWDQTMWTITFDPDADELTIKQNITDVLPSEWAKVIMSATEEECVANFNAMKDKLHQLGLDQLVAAQQAAYSANVAKFNGEF